LFVGTGRCLATREPEEGDGVIVAAHGTDRQL
jgi:hypothetical protein